MRRFIWSYNMAIEKKVKTTIQSLWTMEPWWWARNSANATIGNINFGVVFRFYQKNIEANFFRHFKK
jgi:hypothetical protein